MHTCLLRATIRGRCPWPLSGSQALRENRGRVPINLQATSLCWNTISISVSSCVVFCFSLVIYPFSPVEGGLIFDGLQIHLQPDATALGYAARFNLSTTGASSLMNNCQFQGLPCRGPVSLVRLHSTNRANFSFPFPSGGRGYLRALPILDVGRESSKGA